MSKESMLGRLRKLAAAYIIKNAQWELPTETASADNTRVAPTPAINFPRLTITYPEARVDTYQPDAGGYGGLFGQPALNLRREHAAENYERYYDDLPDWAKVLYQNIEDEYQNPRPVTINSTPSSRPSVAAYYDPEKNEVNIKNFFLENFLDVSGSPITSITGPLIGADSLGNIPPSVFMNIDSPLAPGYLHRLYELFQHEMGHVVSSPDIVNEYYYNSSIAPEYSPDDGESRHARRPAEIYPILQAEIIDPFRASDFAKNNPEREYKLLNTPQGIDWIISNPSIWAGESAITGPIWAGESATTEQIRSGRTYTMTYNNVYVPNEWQWLKDYYPKAYWQNILLPGTIMSENNQQSPASNDLGWA